MRSRTSKSQLFYIWNFVSSLKLQIHPVKWSEPKKKHTNWYWDLDLMFSWHKRLLNDSYDVILISKSHFSIYQQTFDKISLLEEIKWSKLIYKLIWFSCRQWSRTFIQNMFWRTYYDSANIKIYPFMNEVITREFLDDNMKILEIKKHHWWKSTGQELPIIFKVIMVSGGYQRLIQLVLAFANAIVNRWLSQMSYL